jgi:hypothetical protein
VGETGFVGGIKLKVARLIAPINPFAKIGVETPDRASWMPYEGSHYYTQNPLPNPVQDTTFLPAHMDPET